MAVGNPISLTDNVASRIVSQTATASQTDFIISGGYRLNAISVYRNGVRLISGRDYSAADGSTVVLLSPATVSDALEFHIFDDFRVADAIVSNASHQNIEGNLTVTGILTASNLIGSNLELQSLTVTNDVSIGGTLTYQDVKNIDSVGIITARTDVHVGAGLSVVGVSTFHGNAIFNGNVDLGNASGDTITATGRFDSDLIPSADDQKDLGSATVEWRNLYLDGTANIDTLSVSGNSTLTGLVGIGLTNPGDYYPQSDDLVVGTTSGNRGISVVSATTGTGSIVFADGVGNFENRRGQIVYDHSTDSLELFTDQTERLRITSDGSVGIGKTDPSGKLEVNGGYVTLRSGASSYPDGISAPIIYGTTGGGSNSFDQTGNLVLQTRSDAGSYNICMVTGDTPTERLRITSAGKIGIGTDNPIAYLQVYRPTQYASNPIIQARSNNGSTNELKFEIDGDGDAYFNGKIGIGTDNPGHNLHVHGSFPDFAISDSDTTNDKFRILHNGGGTQLQVDPNNVGPNVSYLLAAIDGTERLRITSSGQILTGISTARGNLANNASGVEAQFQIEGTSFTSSTLSVIRNSDDANDGGIILGKTRSSTTYGNASVVAGDDLGDLIFAGSDGTSLQFGAEILAEVQSGVGNDDLPTDLIFKTNGGTTNTTERLRITSAGLVGIGTDNPAGKFEVAGTIVQSVIEYPTIRPTLDLNFAATKILDPTITFTRDSIGTYYDELGVLKYASNNVPRFDHNPTTGESLGLLIEESRTNQFSYSSDFTQSSWVGANISVTADQIVAPDGTTTADKILALSTATQDRYIRDDRSITSGVTYTQSVFVKVGEVTVLQIAPSTGFASKYQNFNLSTGQLGSGDVDGATITAYPNGWYRCTVTQTATLTNAAGRMLFAFASSPTSDRLHNPVFNSGDGLYLWGAQLEVGSFATSYIPTSGTTVTRAADKAKITGTNFTNFFNQTEGTINCAYWLGNDNSGMRVFQINDSDNSVIDIVAGSGGGSGGYGYVSTGGVAQANGGQSSANASYLNTLHVTTLAYKENDVAGINIKTGVLTNDTSATLDGAYNRVTFYQGANGADQLNGHLQRVQYYPKRLPDAQLQGLTQQ